MAILTVRMRFWVKVIVISMPLILVAGALAIQIAMVNRMASSLVDILEIEQKWLVGSAVMYAVTFLASWRFRGVFSVSATRMLAWAIVAYMVMSHGIDVIGEYRGDLSAILGWGPGDLEPSVLIGVRARLVGLLSILTMALTAVAVGFESTK